MRTAMAISFVFGMTWLGIHAASAQATMAERTESWDLNAGGVAGGAGSRLIRLIGLASWADVDRVGAELKRCGAEVLGGIPRLQCLKVVVLDESAFEHFATSSLYAFDVRYIEAEIPLTLTCVENPPNDTSFYKQWHLHNTGQIVNQLPGILGADIDILSAWDIAKGSTTTIVAVTDTGIQISHPEFAGRLVPGYDFVSGDTDPNSTETHGNLVAGIIAANTNNGFGVAGIDQACKIMPIRVTTEQAGGSDWTLAQGIDFATAHGASAINLSVIVDGPSPVVISALRNADEHGVLIIAGSSNSGAGAADIYWPAADPRSTTIGSTNPQDLAEVSSGGGTALDFVAPGFGIYSIDTLFGGDTLPGIGTSMAAPQASGVASLLLSVNPYLSKDQIYGFLLAGAEDQVGDALDTLGWDQRYGHGRLNAFRSLSALCSCTTAQPFMFSPPDLSVVSGGTWVADIDLGPDYAGDKYVVLGSTAGTEPGMMIGQTHIPLNPDEYLHYCVSHANSGPLGNTLGTLDANGRARATIHLPEGLWPAEGLTVQHICAVFDHTLQRPFASQAKFVSPPATARIGNLPQTLFKDAFETPATTWTVDNVPGSPWHVAAPGECGAVTRMLAFSQPASGCSYASLAPMTTSVTSPPFVLSGEWPYRITFDMIRTIDEPHDTTTVTLLDEAGVLKPQKFDDNDLNIGVGLTHVSLSLRKNSTKFVGRTVRLKFTMKVVAGTANGTGWLIDNVAVLNDGMPR